MGRKLSQQQIGFIADVFKEIPAGKAYFTHYKVKSMTVANVCASQLLRTPKISTELQRLRDAAKSALIADEIERKEILSEILRCKTSQFVDENGIIDKTKLDSHAIQSVDEQTTIGGMATVLKLKLHNPIQACDLLNKMDGAYAPQKYTGIIAILSGELTDDQLLTIASKGDIPSRGGNGASEKTPSP